MWFNFCTFNHDPIGRSSLVDVTDWIVAGLTELGHTVTYSDSRVELGAINLFFESFHPGMEAQIRRTGVRYGIIATEIPDGFAFNWRSEAQWKERFECFLRVAQGASFIWTMVESTVPYYSQWCPVAFVELGFSESLAPPYGNSEPDVDFSFFGISTPYRMTAIEKIRRYATVEWPERFLRADEVGDLIGRTRVGLSFKQSELWPVPSPTRLGRFLMARRDIAAERTEVTTRQGEIVGLAPCGQDFVEFALERLGANWRERAESAYEAYRMSMSMSDIMDVALDRTVTGFKASPAGRGSSGKYKWFDLPMFEWP